MTVKRINYDNYPSLENDNLKINIFFKTQQSLVSPFSGVRNASIGLLALSRDTRNVCDPIYPFIIPPILSLSSLDNHDPQIPIL
jgi:hypothetical protein